ncbi:LINE-1 reverse transcriptase [Tetrabaena socialis]|uniref:LINE-1 reverse transcriptase n=1 Tax=Tetrabaena socialis TaxID=47790 RepID=A0A2J8AAK3_9CHLO|nr:LINE-1 reverse transcriptase [Tetrabaena socialis]|eukprot:PNH09547.1 LINE-1 reverse transcriptase [Tetrabaena socialis]
MPAGWFAACKLPWGGHQLQLCSVYFPQAGRPGAAALRQQLCTTCLAPTASQAAADGSVLLWCGDFNFVESPAMDCSAGAAGRHGDTAPAHLLQAAAAAAAMVDSFRTTHPHRRDYTHMYRAPQPGGSRLDRIYLPAAASPFLARASIHFATPSDHRIALVHLNPKQPPAARDAPRRLRTFFTAHRDLKQQMGAWLDGQVASAPTGDAQILSWWAQFKRKCTAKAASLNREAVTRRTRPSANLRQLRDAEQAAASALDAAPHDAARLADAVEAQVAVSAAMRSEAGAEVLSARHAWISDGERPNPALTTLVRDSGGDSGPGPTALHDPSTGHLVSNPASVPQVIANYWRDVSALPSEAVLPAAVKQQAQAAVLEALRAHPLRLPAAEAQDEVGRPEVTSIEVARALRATPRGKAPGWDGLPADLYKAFSRQFSPLLAALYTAIGATGTMPARFTDGIITVLYKKGVPTEPGNYRPINLLNTDYRVLAKVLATRLGPALHAAIAAEQTAFLPGRLIGTNIFALRHIPHLLKRQGRSAIIAFLDFAKAYDTVHRDFLLAAMAELGATESLQKWVRTLLSATQAQAQVGGRLSQPVSMAAGVRQGCPLAPLLYLFVAQALLSWLQRKGMGVRLDPTDAERMTAVQFADDGQVLLEGEGAVPAFLAAMQTFAQATGQHLNLVKVELLRPDWQSTVTAAKQRMHRLTQTQLSAFGRCAGVSAYALQMNTYHWEHGGMPPGDEVTLLEGWAAGVGDRRASPLAPSQRLTGIPRHLLHGHPTVGGFGLLPLTLHTRARNAVWAARLAGAAGQPADASHHPWTRIVALYLHLHHPLLSLSSVLTAAAPSAAAAAGGGEPLPAEIRRITAALGYLPPVQEVDTTPMPAPGDWCFNVPLWGNPLLPNAAAATAAGAAAAADAATAATAAAGAADPDFEPDDPQLAADAAAAALPRPGLDCRHTRLATCTALRTVGDAVRIGRAVSGAPLGGPEWLTWVAEQLAPRNASTFRRSTVTAAITGLLNDISAEWRDAAAAALDRAGGDGQAAAAALAGAGVESEAEMRAQCVNRVGWRLSPSLVIRPRKLTVGIATMLQHQVGAQQRARLHAAYEREARQQPPANPPMGGQPAEMQASCVPPVLQRLWGMQWEREHKETMWRLAIDAVPLPGNSHLRGMQPEQCGCGGYGGAGAQPCSPRAHHFWECPVAKAVVAQIAAHVPGPVSRAHVWLAEAPPGMQQGVWDAVALAALSAMERARVGLRAATRHAAGGAAAGGAAGAGVAPPPAVEVAKARAVLEFWQRLRGFAELGVPSRGWGEVGAEHPILSVEDGRMRCAPPAGLDLDSDP